LGAEPCMLLKAAEALGKIGDISATPALAQGLNDEDNVVGIECAKLIAAVTVQQFPDMNGTGYSLDENGAPLIVTSAKNWWDREGRYKSWMPLDVDIP